MFEAHQVVARRPGCSSIAFHERMNPVHPPKSVRRKPGGMINQRPVFMNQGKESIHQLWNFSKMRRNVVTHQNWLFAVSSTKLSNVGNGSIVQGPECVFVEGFNALFYCDL